jgi:hypothetical protein
MTVTHEIETRDWEEYLEEFSQRNQGRPVRLETSLEASAGQRVVAEHRPLLGVSLDPKGSEAPAVTVTLGGMNAGTAHLTHVITTPTHLWAEEEPGGIARALDIDSTDEGKTLLLFEREAALSP